MLEHLLMSAPQHDGVSFCERVEQLGGYANADTGLERMHFYARVRSEYADDITALLCSSIIEPFLSEADLDRERDVIQQELIGAAADPSELVQDAILGKLFPAHPLGLPVAGDLPSIMELTLKDVQHRHRTAVLSSRMALVAVGPRETYVDLSRFRDELPTVKIASTTPLEELSPADLVWPKEYGWLCVGARSPALGDPNWTTFRILATLLGSSPSSLLYKKLRNERGLAYNFHAWDRGYAEAGAWRLLIGLAGSNGPEILGIVRDILTELAESGPCGDDLAFAMRHAATWLTLKTEDPLQFAQAISDKTRGDFTGWLPEADTDPFQSVTAHAVSRAAEHVLREMMPAVSPAGEAL
jgi:predicted Zn-dependent peptidase